MSDHTFSVRRTKKMVRHVAQCMLTVHFFNLLLCES